MGGIVAAIVLAVVAFAAALAPAGLLDGPLAVRTQQRWRFVDATGFWWHGRGVVASADGVMRVPIDWQLDAGALARGAIVVLVGRTGDAPLHGTLTLHADGFDVHDLHARMPASVVAALDPRLQAVTPGGHVTFEAPAVAAAGDSVSGSIDAAWTRARVVAGDAIVDLGTVALKSSATNQPWSASVQNSGGDVAVTGTIVDRNGATDATFDLRPAATAPVAVRNALSLLGAPDANGVVHFAWRNRR
jgi:hypothetical protein